MPAEICRTSSDEFLKLKKKTKLKNIKLHSLKVAKGN